MFVSTDLNYVKYIQRRETFARKNLGGCYNQPAINKALSPFSYPQRDVYHENELFQVLHKEPRICGGELSCVYRRE